MHTEEGGLVATLEALVRRGADPDATTTGGVTALMLATQRDHPDVVASLLSLGADPDVAAKDGRTALSIARARGHEKIAELLERSQRSSSRLGIGHRSLTR